MKFSKFQSLFRKVRYVVIIVCSIIPHRFQSLFRKVRYLMKLRSSGSAYGFNPSLGRFGTNCYEYLNNTINVSIPL